MSDVAEVFNTLKDSATGAGEGLISRIEGEVAAGQEGSIGFAFKDASGNVVLPQLDAQGRIPVSEIAGSCKYAVGELLAGSVGSSVKVTGAEIALTAAKVYHEIGVTGSCTRTSVFELVHIDDEGVTDTEVVLERFIVGPGQFTFASELKCREIDTTGGTGTIVLTLRAENLEKASTLRGSISAVEVIT